MEDDLGLAGPVSALQSEIARSKFDYKYSAKYKDLGKTPGILTEDNKRRKIVRDLGGELRGDKKLEEEKKESPLIDEGISTTTAELLKVTAEREKTQALSMIPEKYRIKESQEVKATSTALSLVNALANNQNSIAIRSRKVVHP